MDLRLNVCAKTQALNCFFNDFGLGSRFLDLTPKVQETKEKTS